MHSKLSPLHESSSADLFIVLNGAKLIWGETYETCVLFSSFFNRTSESRKCVRHEIRPGYLLSHAPAGRLALRRQPSSHVLVHDSNTLRAHRHDVAQLTCRQRTRAASTFAWLRAIYQTRRRKWTPACQYFYTKHTFGSKPVARVCF